MSPYFRVSARSVRFDPEVWTMRNGVENPSGLRVRVSIAICKSLEKASHSPGKDTGSGRDAP